ncbi:MAG: hypothetical protein ACRDJK_04765 [Actinomycetota bacterium]
MTKDSIDAQALHDGLTQARNRTASARQKLSRNDLAGAAEELSEAIEALNEVEGSLRGEAASPLGGRAR